MGGGARPAGWSDFVHRCCLVLCAAAMTGLGAAELSAQTSPGNRQTTSRQATPPGQSKQTDAAQQSPKSARPANTAHRAARRTARASLDGRALAALSERLNNNTLAIISGGLGSTDLAVAQELSAVLDDGDNLRILPMVGAGGGRNVRDVRFMKGVDLGIAQSNLLARIRASSEIGPIDDKIVYVAKLFNEEMHLVVRADSGITAIDQLAGRAVNLGDPGSGTQLIGHDVLDRLGIAVREVNMATQDAVDRLKAGDIDAVVLIGGRPVPALASLAGCRILPVPFMRQLRDDFLPAALSSDDYPELIDPGRRVETLAVGTVLIAYNWPKDSDHYKKIEKFVAAFFPQIAKLQASPRHPKWREVNLAATLPGWTRFAAAEDWLKQHRESAETAETDRARFDRFVGARQAQPASTEERERLFQEFLQWNEAREHR
jgi:TRAP transporter TAXI family solute receptor